jgi:hypothetical protein
MTLTGRPFNSPVLGCAAAAASGAALASGTRTRWLPIRGLTPSTTPHSRLPALCHRILLVIPLELLRQHPHQSAGHLVAGAERVGLHRLLRIGLIGPAGVVEIRVGREELCLR